MAKPKILPIVFNHGFSTLQIEDTPIINPIEKEVTIIELEQIKENLKVAYADTTGKLFIETPFAETYSIYKSINDYNQRLCLPYFESKRNINFGNMSTVFINLETLIIN